jgi:hypothetical protein
MPKPAFWAWQWQGLSSRWARQEPSRARTLGPPCARASAGGGRQPSPGADARRRDGLGLLGDARWHGPDGVPGLLESWISWIRWRRPLAGGSTGPTVQAVSRAVQAELSATCAMERELPPLRGKRIVLVFHQAMMPVRDLAFLPPRASSPLAKASLRVQKIVPVWRLRSRSKYATLSRCQRVVV